MGAPEKTRPSARRTLSPVAERRSEPRQRAHAELGLDAVMSAMPDLYAVVDRDFCVVAVSDAYARAARTTREALVGRCLFEAFPDEDLEAPESTWMSTLRASFERVLARRSADAMPAQRCWVRRHREPDGQGFDERYWKSTNYPILDEGPDGRRVSAILHRVEDVTDLIQLEERGEDAPRDPITVDSWRLFQGMQKARMEADAQRARLYTLIMQAPIPVGIFDGPEHEIELANEVCDESLFGGRSVIGMTVREALPEAAGQGLFQIFDLVYRSGEPFSASQFPIRLDRTGDGELEDTWWNLTLQPTRDLAGKVDGILAMAVEVTELKRSDLDRSRLLERERTARAEAEKANRAKDEFLAMLGHELRNPLSPIVTALQLMKMRREGGQAGEAERVIERQVQHLVRLVDDLLDVSRITRGKVALKRRVVEVAEVVAKAIEQASPLLEQRHHQLEVRVAREGLPVCADEVRLAQIIGNLVNNAAKYTEAGGAIAVSAEREDDEIVIRVEDNGIGIAPEMLPRIFDLFVQGERSLDRAEGGLGIGLTLVRNLVTLHGGTVTAHSDGPQRGSAFVVRLPAGNHATAATAAREAREELAAPTREASRLPLRVLVVDDNVDAAELVCEVLRTVGHEVAVAYDGPQALSLAEGFNADVALLDIGLPVMDGYELARRLRERASDLRLIAVTGYGQEADLERTRETGFERHFVKPVDANTLLRAIDSAAVRAG